MYVSIDDVTLCSSMFAAEATHIRVFFCFFSSEFLVF